MEAHFYEVNVSWNSGRKGVMCSPELEATPGDRGCIEVATPPQFPKGIPGIWSPEHLFTAAVSTCLMTTFLAVAENSKLDFTRFSCKSKGKLDNVDGKFMMSEIQLEPKVTISHEEDRDKALRVLEKSEKACLITHSVKSQVNMKPVIEIAEVELK